ncbi:iron-containing alcohol dehydrogenase [Sporomusa acidovorans]|uniref:Long-chain-alcohol dehydrogenase 1 n=1 Tax=Sporomusa acidovorans (strain ATCC 49682 / DSM 3132 / Mol) TaxID=1123286 RepID=A0ABZ3J577_SPOA4|nr:iron-containing alcohol dehydrogenase [Sporomusa acidovorans]OZC15697.1 alcohol dehydrogenase [Sporomusa acidovorans DSM 3132]SDE89168.1 Alcohol dehydrogenase, class IV [Sporomusa acidovorans]
MSSFYSLLNIRKIVAGAGSIAQIADVVADYEAKNVVIITDLGVWNSGLVEKPKALLAAAGINVHVINDTPPEPSVDQVNGICQAAKAFDCQLIIGIGGGSSIDTAKIVSVLFTNDIVLRELVKGKAQIKRRGIPTLMIPTTAGTGAEATPNAIVLVPEEELKVGIVSDKMVSDSVILDPEMTVNLPKQITANTGMDALCHAIECYISKKANPLSDTFALKAITLISRSIRTAYKDGGNLAAREDMLLGAMFGGISIATASTTAVHALSYPLGGKYHIPHGLSNAILLADVMKFNLDVCEDKFRDIAMAMGIEVTGCTTREAAEKMIDNLYSMIKDLEIKCDLRAKGINEEALDDMIEAAAKVTRLLNNNPKIVTKDDMREIYKKLL